MFKRFSINLVVGKVDKTIGSRLISLTKKLKIRKSGRIKDSYD